MTEFNAEGHIGLGFPVTRNERILVRAIEELKVEIEKLKNSALFNPHDILK